MKSKNMSSAAECIYRYELPSNIMTFAKIEFSLFRKSEERFIAMRLKNVDDIIN